jgi:MoaE-MoaD fusion protein
MRVSVRLFAVLRELAGRDSLELELADGATVADAIEALRSEPGLGEPLTRMSVALAVNREYAAPETALETGDELALVPPVSGGAGDVHVRIGEEPLSVEAVSATVGRSGAGAVVSFQGTTRDVERLDYEAYAEMAAERIEAILRDCVEAHGLEAAGAEHRIGPVALGEASVIVAVSAAHRAEAFAGAREAIDRIKAEAPIWKREVEGGEARWVEGAPAPGATHVPTSGAAPSEAAGATGPEAGR